MCAAYGSAIRRRAPAICDTPPLLLDITAMPGINPNIEIQPLEDKLLILDLDRNAYYSLNGTARFFLEKTAQSLEFDQIIEAALDEFDIDRPRLTQDFLRLRDELTKLKILIP